MNYWKPIALTLAVGLVASIGMQTASANNAGSQPSLTGECHDQKNMAAALHELSSAKDSLTKAEHNKAGWRDRALDSVNKAINETTTGCTDATH